jgi:ERCC4-type nuclease
MEIFIDEHEDDKEQLIEMLSDKGKNDVSVKTLLCGDYYCPQKNVLVEKKKLLDYVNSVRNGLIFQQAQDLLYNQKMNPDMKIFIIISGNIGDIIKIKGAQAAPLIAAWASLNAQGIPTSFVSNEWFFCKGLLYLFEKIDDGKNREYNPVRKPQEFEDFITTNYASISWLTIGKSLLPTTDGIGEKTAKKLREKFPIPKKLYNATLDELMEVDGIGKPTAEKLIKFFNGEK